MIHKVRVENYKSIPSLDLDLGRLTVLIGANGSGKSNILEAIAFASAAAQNKLDNEFLASRGIRVTEARFMRSAFDGFPSTRESIKISVEGDNEVAFDCELSADKTASYPKWELLPSIPIRDVIAGLETKDLASKSQEALESLRLLLTPLPSIRGREVIPYLECKDLAPEPQEAIESLRRVLTQLVELWLTQSAGTLPGFLVYAPENSALRNVSGRGTNPPPRNQGRRPLRTPEGAGFSDAPETPGKDQGEVEADRLV